ncbi:hypothetical protein GE061_014532 [Apolygus lucorum]|uniref:Methyltransferase type 12 domain-containing protein n=1 Tax=Apolygus lucorum TaxID=248454 RepID=A0A6A4JKI2_APOLU|nr:hypothetical protein GE061_014532 [Apolygus lucorum]
MKPEFEAYWNPDLRKDQGAKIVFQPAERNKGPIFETLQKYIDTSLPKELLEISSGSGQHVAYIASKCPNLTFQPTEFEERYCVSIAEYIRDAQLTNVLPPLRLDVSQPVELWADGSLGPKSFDYVLNINLVHVSPWSCSEGLFRGCSVILKPGGLLFTYGPFAENGVIFPESNAEFDRNIRQQDPSWGLRDIERELKPLASSVGLELIDQHHLPANNRLLVWKKVGV